MRRQRQLDRMMIRLVFSAAVLAMASCSSAPGPVVPETKVERQMIGLLEKFDRWDLNGDGQLDANELKAAQKVTGHSPQEILDFYDVDRSGGVSLREAQRGFKRADEAEEKIKNS